MLNLFWNVVDGSWGAVMLSSVFALVFMLVVSAQFRESWSSRARWLGRLIAYGVGWLLCAVALPFLGSPPDRLIVLRLGEEVRLTAVQQTRFKNGGSCHVSTYGLDGSFIRSTSHRGDCEGSGASGTLLVHANPLFWPDDHLLIDLWTGEAIAWRSSLVEGPHQVKRVGSSGIEVLRSDGTQEHIPWPQGRGASSLREISGGRKVELPPLLDVRHLSGTCAGRPLVRHRSVAFGDGITYVSALIAPGGETLWTVDMTEAWGERELLGVVDHDGRCWAIGAARGFGIRVVGVP